MAGHCRRIFSLSEPGEGIPCNSAFRDLILKPLNFKCTIASHAHDFDRQKVLREEVKDQMKWDVDRSSSSTKIRELMAWSHDIINDIYYQKRKRRNPFFNLLIQRW